MIKKIIFILIICIGLFLRLYYVSSLPGGLFMDEVAIGVDAKTIAEHGTDQFGNVHPFFFENLTDYKMPVYIYLTAAAYKLLGSQIITVRLAAILTGLGLLISIPYLARLLFPEKKCLPYSTATVLLLSPFAVHVSRIGYETTVATFLLSVFLIGYLHVLQRNRMLMWSLIGGAAAILSTWTYPVHRLVVPGFLIAMLCVSFLFHFAHIQKKHFRIVTAGFIASVFIGAVPLLLSATANKRALGYIGQGKTIFQTISAIGSSWLRLWNLEFLFDKGDLFAYRHGTKENGIFLSFFLIPYVVGLWYVFRTFTRKHFSLVFLAVFTVVAGLPSALTSSVPYATRIVPMLIPYAILIGLGIEEGMLFLSKRNAALRKGIYVLVPIIIAYQVALFSHIYFVHFKETSLPEFPSAPVALAAFLNSYTKEHPSTPIYFLQNKSCHAWGHDELQVWYFMDLPSDQMIPWSNRYRTLRTDYFNTHHMATIDVYDQPIMPKGRIDSIVLFPGDMSESVPGLHVICGYNSPTVDTKKQKIDKVFYMYEDIHQEPYYVVTEDK